jgi:hypothetical protein
MTDKAEKKSKGEETWTKARKKPVEIEFRGPYVTTTQVETLEGDFEVDEEYIEEHGGYVIIRGVDGEKYPCALDIFKQTYDVQPDGGSGFYSGDPQ